MSITELQVGPEMDAEVERRVFGNDLRPPREYAMARVGSAYVSSTGPVFIVRINGERLDIPMPPGKALRQPEGSDDWNDRYYLYVAEKLGDRIAAEVEAYRYLPKPYSTDIAAAWRVVEYLLASKDNPQRDFHIEHLEDEWSVSFCHVDDEWQRWRSGLTAPEAICRAALVVLASAD